GSIGDAALFLKGRTEFAARYFAPEPRLALGAALHGIASACIDISDGLLADAHHIANTSGVGMIIQREHVPHSSDDWETILTGGDDYELCFTASPNKREAIAALSKKLNLPLTCIGTVTQERGLRVVDRAEKDVTPAKLGFEHA